MRLSFRLISRKNRHNQPINTRVMTIFLFLRGLLRVEIFPRLLRDFIGSFVVVRRISNSTTANKVIGKKRLENGFG